MSNYGYSTGLGDAARMQRAGDALFPKACELYDAGYLKTQGLEIPSQIGGTKLIPYAEFLTETRLKTALYRLYYLNSPPIPSIDYEDPNKEMLRIFVPLGREVVSKGAKFLFGKERFYGKDSFVFEQGSQSFRKEFDKFWYENNMDVLLKRVGRTNLWSGRCFLKFTASLIKELNIILPQEQDERQEELDERAVEVKEKIKETKIIVTYTQPDFWHCVTAPNNPKEVIAWVYQFESPNGDFYREEIFDDATYIYSGKRQKSISTKSGNPVVSISNSGFKEVFVTEQTENIIFTLQGVIPYPELGMFPVVPFFNESDADNDGTSVYQGLTGKFDACNDLFTRNFYALQNQATPLLWMNGVKQGTGNDVHASDAIWTFEDKDSELHVLQWEGTPQAVFQFYEEIKDLVYKSVGVPKSADLKAFTNISGEALNAVNTDIVDTTNDRRLDYEQSFRILVKLLRKILGQAKEIERTMSIIWGPVFPESKDKIGETMVTLAREKLISRKRAIELHPMIPNHLKEDLGKEAAEMEKKDDELRQQAIDAQSARITQRAGGAVGGNKERGAALKKPKV